MTRFSATLGGALLALALGALSLGSVASPALAKQPSSSAGYTLFGAATTASPGNGSPTAIQLTSNTGNASTADDFSGIDFAVPAGMTYADLSKLSTDYNFTHNGCGGGSPRFQVNVTKPGGTTANVFVYIGPPPSYTNCPTGVWTNSGNLVTPASLVDTSQLGGAFYDSQAHADAAYGSYPVTGIQLVADGGWFFSDGQQTVLVDNVMISGTTYTFESQDSCKNGGWQQFTSAPGPFKNQGDCVSHFASGGKND
jgi:hypothetical protein